MSQMLPQVDRSLCIGCGRCIEVCPTAALGQVDGRAALVQPNACIWCSLCEHICPTEAIGLPYVIRFAAEASAPPDAACSIDHLHEP